MDYNTLYRISVFMNQYHQWHFQLGRYNKRVTVSLAFALTLLFATFSTSTSYLNAQQQQTQNTTPTTSATSEIGVKITSPARGQQVPVGSLTISGTSKDNTNSNDCTVYAIWDHLKPYQKVEPTGLGGSDDYSNWAFTYTSAYHLITNGTNQLTAKISCLASSSSSASNVTKWYSINVTGVQVASATSVSSSINQANNNNNAPTTSTDNPYASTPLLLPLPSTKHKSETDSTSEPNAPLLLPLPSTKHKSQNTHHDEG
jgi:hypothetical protein